MASPTSLTGKWEKTSSDIYPSSKGIIYSAQIRIFITGLGMETGALLAVPPQ